MSQNKVVIDVEANNKTQRVFHSVETESDRAGKSAGDKFSAGLTSKFAELSNKLSGSLNQSLGSVSTRFKTLFSRVSVDSDRSGRESGDKFRTGFSGKLINLTEDLAGKTSDAFNAVGENASKAISNAVGSLPPMGQLIAGVLVTGLVVALAPALTAAISSAVLLAVGGGVLGAGLMFAFKNSKVKEAGSTFRNAIFGMPDADRKKLEDDYQKIADKISAIKGKSTKSAADQSNLKDLQEQLKNAGDQVKMADNYLFGRATKSFQKPLIAGLQGATKFFEKLEPTLTRIFDKVSTAIEPLGKGLGGLFTQMLPGIESAVEASVPLFQILADKLPVIGAALSDFFESISENGEDTNLFFSDLLDVIIGLIAYTGEFIGAVTKLYSAWRKGMENMVKATTSLARSAIGSFGAILDAAVAALSWIPGLGPKLKGAQEKFKEFSKKANKWLDDIDKSVTVTVTIKQVFTHVGQILTGLAGQLAHQATGGISTAATGGIRNNKTLVGENGPEIVDLAPGSTVHNAGATRNMMSNSGNDINVTLTIDATDSDASRFVASMARKFIQANGGNAQKALGQAGR